MPITLALIGAGVGVGKGVLYDQPQAERDRKLAAETQRFSPWTGLKAQPVKEANVMGDAMTFGLAGASMGQNMEAAKAQNGLTAAMTNYYNKGGMGSTANTGLAKSSFWSAPTYGAAKAATAPPVTPWSLGTRYGPSADGSGGNPSIYPGMTYGAGSY